MNFCNPKERSDCIDLTQMNNIEAFTKTYGPHVIASVFFLNNKF